MFGLWHRRLVILVIGIMGLLTPVPTLHAQEVLNDISLLRCVRQGMRLDALTEMDLPRKIKEQAFEEIDNSSEDLLELNDKYRQAYQQMQSQFAAEERARKTDRLAREAGELEGERLGRILELEITLRRLLGTSDYGTYREKIKSKLQQRINELHRRLIPEDLEILKFHIPRLEIDRDPVNFCPGLPQPGQMLK